MRQEVIDEGHGKDEQIATARTKAIAWLRVAADIAAPTERNVGEAADVAGRDHAVIRMAQDIDGDNKRKRQQQRDGAERPGCPAPPG